MIVSKDSIQIWTYKPERKELTYLNRLIFNNYLKSLAKSTPSKFTKAFNSFLRQFLNDFHIFIYSI